MLKEKWEKLLLREKVLFISGISVILSIPLLLITLYSVPISVTFFVGTAFYNLYKSLQMADLSISDAIETDMQKGERKFKERKMVSGIVMFMALPLAIGMGIPTVFVLLIYLWVVAI